MSATKYTPGPWAATARRDGSSLRIGIRQKLEGVESEDHCTVVALHGTPSADSVARANAALIVAAPQVFAALKSALPVLRVAYMNHPSNHKGCGPDCPVVAAESAVSRVERRHTVIISRNWERLRDPEHEGPQWIVTPIDGASHE